MNEVIPSTLPLRDSQPIDTSGTVGMTIVDTISVIEMAVRRCGKNPATLTPENLDSARNNLFFILSKLPSRGYNLWAVEQLYLPVVGGKMRYAMPPNTEDVLKAVLRTPQTMPQRPVAAGPAVGRMFDSDRNVSLIGFKFNTEITEQLSLDITQIDNPTSSIAGIGTDWVEFQRLPHVPLSPGWHWFVLDPSVRCRGVRLRYATGGPLATHTTEFIAAESYTDDPLTRYNRDDYTELNNKTLTGKPSAYFFEKKIESAVSFWPVPDNEQTHVVLWRHRAIQDVGNLMGKLEIPARWYEAITWMLARNLSYELEGVTNERIAMVGTNAATEENAAELGESDGAPMYIRPSIGHYTA